MDSFIVHQNEYQCEVSDQRLTAKLRTLQKQKWSSYFKTKKISKHL